MNREQDASSSSSYFTSDEREPLGEKHNAVRINRGGGGRGKREGGVTGRSVGGAGGGSVRPTTESERVGAEEIGL